MRFFTTKVLVLLAAGACSGSMSPSSNGTDDGPSDDGRGGEGGGAGAASMDGSGGSVAMPAEPIVPSELDALCTKDAAHPRRLLRLAPGELVASLRAGLAVDDAMVPASFASSVAKHADDSLVVSRDFLEDTDRLATAAAAKLAGAPGNALSCDVAKFGADAACTKTFLTNLTNRLYRGRAVPDDLTSLGELARKVAERSGGKRALEIATRAAMLSPKSLYLSEGLDGADPAKAAPMSAPEIAAFLSYRVTGGPPSDALIAAAKANHPPTVEGMRKLLDQLGAEALRTATAGFLGTWLDTGDIANVKRDLMKHPKADAAFMKRLADETDGALTSLARTEGLDLSRLLTGDVKSSLLEDDRSPLASTIGRPGVFALPGVLAAISSGDHTNIPRRGRLILQNLFCQPSPIPPPNALTQQPNLREGASERERFEAVEMQGACRACHLPINHLAFPFESYDELGTMRTTDEHGNRIDTAATFTPVGQNALTYKDVRDLMNQAAKSSHVETCVSLHAFRQAARRGERGGADACLVRDLAQTARGNGFRVADLVRDALARTAAADRAN